MSKIKELRDSLIEKVKQHTLTNNTNLQAQRDEATLRSLTKHFFEKLKK